ncbi:MAG: S8 family peptidase [Pseudobdellovibrio sp.]
MKNSFLALSFCLTSISTLAAINKNVKFKPAFKNQVTVAVIDTGLDVNHREFKDSLWTNEGEIGLDKFGHDKSNNQIDDDDNGFVDDVHGWNFVSNSNDLLDSMGHGTHVSGIIKNESGRSPSLKKEIKLMILKYYDANCTDSENVDNTVKAINYAVKMGAQVINYSGGGSLPNKYERMAIEKANQSKIIFVAAAGNNKSNTDINNYFPADYGLENIISVAATDNSGNLVNFSNYGMNTVDVGAPGKQIFSTLPNNEYGFMSGTSQSTAFVTGIVAQRLAHYGSAQDPEKIKSEVLKMARYNKTLAGKTKFQLALTSSEMN